MDYSNDYYKNYAYARELAEEYFDDFDSMYSDEQSELLEKIIEADYDVNSILAESEESDE